MEEDEKQSSKRYVIGEGSPPKTLTTIRLTTSHSKCVYYDVVTNELVKVEVPFEDLEKVEE
ncbi:hypothetical protein [Leptospira noguchii]|uniref:PF09926 repeat protein n=2 Tax=Leptospira noguchii TaxID=28182 RepID=M6Y7I4_9LEPT|nr:hypothetical protein [Leptospira noguchii]EMN02944.1 hypothetical protein LEP1GSC035_0364 [Leptospira noguchii str. 2007001578]EMO87811.1 hypothetical protein LEP1GSC024_1871 [Leptospira noguchii str. 2001034031]